MSQIPEEVDAIVVVFVMKGCGHCEDYLPTFRQVARNWNRTVPAYEIRVDKMNEEQTRFADRMKIEATPTTVAVSRRSGGAVRLEGAQAPEAVNFLFQKAHTHNVEAQAARDRMTRWFNANPPSPYATKPKR